MKNRTIILTHAEQSLETLKNSLENKGFNVLHYPVISIEKADFKFSNSTYDWIVFTSRYGVKYFFEGIKSSEMEAIKNAKTKFACIGKFTAKELTKFGFVVDFVSPMATSEVLSKLLAEKIGHTEKVLLALGKLAGKTLTERLKHIKHLTRIDVYNNILLSINDDFRRIIKNKEFDRIAFASPSAVDFLQLQIKDKFKNINSKAVAIGTVTASSLTKNNIDKLWISDNERSSLLDTIVNSFEN